MTWSTARQVYLLVRGVTGTMMWMTLCLSTVLRCASTRLVPHALGLRKGHPDRGCRCRPVLDAVTSSIVLEQDHGLVTSD